jgi:hypothetical protein
VYGSVLTGLREQMAPSVSSHASLLHGAMHTKKNITVYQCIGLLVEAVVAADGQQGPLRRLPHQPLVQQLVRCLGYRGEARRAPAPAAITSTQNTKAQLTHIM